MLYGGRGFITKFVISEVRYTRVCYIAVSLYILDGLVGIIAMLYA